MSYESASHTFGLVECWISNTYCCFLKAGAIEKIKTNTVFDIQHSTSPNWLHAKVINLKLSIRFMPCPFTGPKMFCAGPNILYQPKN